MRRTVLLVLLLVLLPLVLASCRKVTGGGQMECIGPWSQVGLFTDLDGDGDFDFGQGLWDGTTEFDWCSFGFTAQPADDPATPYDYEAQGQMQFIDHTLGINVHFTINDDTYWWYGDNDTTSSFTGWAPEGVGRVRIGRRSFVINQGEFRVSTGRWAIVDRSVPANNALYPEWPHRPIIEEGYGDTLYVSIYYNDWNDDLRWVGVVQRGNLTIHDADG